VAVLSARSWRAVKPNVLKKTSLVLHIGNAALSGLMWWQLGYREKDIFPRYTVAFAIPIAWIFFPLLDSLGFVGQAKEILRKDMAVNAYRLEAWFLVDSTIQLVPMFVQSFLFLIVFFALAGISTNALVFFALYGVLVASFFVFQSIGLMFSAGVSEKNVSTVAMLFVTFVFLFTGLFVPVKDTGIPWAIYINPFLYIFKLSADAVFQIDGKKFKCGHDAEGDGTLYPKSCGPGGDGRITVHEIYKEYDLNRFSATDSVIALIVMFTGCRLIAYALLRRRMKKHFREMMQFEAAESADGAKGISFAETGQGGLLRSDSSFVIDEEMKSDRL